MKIITLLSFGLAFFQELPFEDTSIKTDLKVWNSSDIGIREMDLGAIKGPIQTVDSEYKFIEHMIYLDNEKTVYVDINV